MRDRPDGILFLNFQSNFMSNNKSTGIWNASMQDIFALFKPLANPERATTRVLYIIGMLLSPITMAGML